MPSHLVTCLLLADSSVSCVARARRFIDPAALVDPVVAGNPLPYEPSGHIEYLIHGQFKRTEDDRWSVLGALGVCPSMSTPWFAHIHGVSGPDVCYIVISGKLRGHVTAG